MNSVTPHPYRALIDALEVIIDAKVSARLQQAGHGTPDPRSLRISRGVDLPTLASKSGISKATLSRLERGLIKQPTVDTMNRAARGLGIPEITYRESIAAMLQK
jgi:DNA-binding XRE family transcriptional regulator